MANFMTKIERRSVEPIEFEDLVRIKNYQLELINSMLYEFPDKCHNSIRKYQSRRNGLIAEIQRVEAWLKVKFIEFANDNNRKQTA